MVSYLNGAGLDNKLRSTDVGGSSYFITDQFGTTRGTADATGNLSTTIAYDSFGNVASGSANSRYTYTGRELDSETSLVYYRARWYTPGEGRFASEDPIGLRGGINTFSYARNNPVNFVDPLGLTRCNRLLGTVAGALIGAGVGGLAGEAVPTGAGALVGSAVGPGGTAVGAGIGAAAGLPLAYATAAAGATIGGIAGYLYCAGDDAKSEPRAIPRCDPKPSPTPRKDKNCTLIAEIPVANNPALKTCVYACKEWRGSTINVVQYANLPCPEEDPYGWIPRPTIPGIYPSP